MSAPGKSSNCPEDMNIIVFSSPDLSTWFLTSIPQSRNGWQYFVAILTGGERRCLWRMVTMRAGDRGRGRSGDRPYGMARGASSVRKRGRSEIAPTGWHDVGTGTRAIGDRPYRLADGVSLVRERGRSEIAPTGWARGATLVRERGRSGDRPYGMARGTSLPLQTVNVVSS